MISPSIISNITSCINEGIQRNIFPGCVIGIVNKHGDRIVLPFGQHTYEPLSKRITTTSIFDVASLTKVIPTSTAALWLVDQKRINLTVPVITWLPEIKNYFRECIQVIHLLTQTLDFGFRFSELKDRPVDEIFEKLFSSELTAPPGTVYSYCNATSILLGLLVERVFGKPLDIIAQQIFFDPLGMNSTSFSPEKMDITTIVPTEYDEWRNRLICGEVHDESAWVLRQKMVPGSAGLFSTVPDIMNFLSMIINRGHYDGQTLFSKSIIEAMATDQQLLPTMPTGLGWELNQRHYVGNKCSNATISKTGFTGCMMACDLHNQTGIVMLSNYVYPKRKARPQQIHEIRARIVDCIMEMY